MRARLLWMPLPVLFWGCIPNPIAPPETPCPVVVDDGPGFTVTFPCGVSLKSSTDPVSSSRFFRDYRDESDNAYLLTVLSTTSLISLMDAESIRFVGTQTTQFGDLLVLADIAIGPSDVARTAVALLADEELLVCTISRATLPAGIESLVFATIDLLDTDGLGINARAMQGVATLLVPATELTALLSDNSVYRLNQSALRDVSAWSAGDPILVNESGAFDDPGGAFFLTNIGEWRSQPADFLGIAEPLTLTAVSSPPLASTRVTLSDKRTWQVSGSDVFKLDDWAVGDAIALVQDPGPPLGQSHILFNVTRGDQVAVSFAG